MATASAIRNAIKELKGVGYVEVMGDGHRRRRGPHRKFHHPQANHTVTLPYRPNTDRMYGGKPKEIAVAVELGRRHSGQED